jgi:hypothetical protein
LKFNYKKGESMKNVKMMIVLSGLIVGAGLQAMCPFKLANRTGSTIFVNIGNARAPKPESMSTFGYKMISNNDAKCFFKGRLHSNIVNIAYQDMGKGVAYSFDTGVQDLKTTLGAIDYDKVVAIRPVVVKASFNKPAQRTTKLIFFGQHKQAMRAAAVSLTSDGEIKVEALGRDERYDDSVPSIREFKQTHGIRD